MDGFLRQALNVGAHCDAPWVEWSYRVFKIYSKRRRNIMEQNNEVKEQSVDQTENVKDTSVITPSPGNGRTKTTISPQTDGGSCPTCGGGATSTPPSYVYALGRVEARFPRLSVEKEFVQATGRGDTAGLTDRQTLHKILSERQNRYLVRQLCWVFTIEGLETYILMPRDPADFDLLVEALRPAPRPTDVDIVVGMRGPIAPPEMCNGLMVPIVAFDQMYSFDIDSLIKSVPRPKEIAAKEFTPAAEELFMRIMQMADNAGATDEHRALNYLVVRYPAIYAMASEAFGRNSSLTAVEVRLSSLSSTRKIVEVIFSFTNRNTDVTEKFFVRVDVTEEFPFLVTRMSPYYDR
jgi:cyclic patellamide precursor peptide PatG